MSINKLSFEPFCVRILSKKSVRCFVWSAQKGFSSNRLHVLISLGRLLLTTPKSFISFSCRVPELGWGWGGGVKLRPHQQNSHGNFRWQLWVFHHTVSCQNTESVGTKSTACNSGVVPITTLCFTCRNGSINQANHTTISTFQIQPEKVSRAS